MAPRWDVKFEPTSSFLEKKASFCCAEASNWDIVYSLLPPLGAVPLPALPLALELEMAVIDLEPC